MNNKFCIIGVDGFEWNLIRRHNQQLPNIQKLIDKSAFGPLRSTKPPVTAPAWTSLFTGCNPGSHGIIDFETNFEGKWDFVDSTSIEKPMLWDILSINDISSVVHNVPLTYPPKSLKGKMVTGRLTPENNEFTYPQELKNNIAFEPGIIKGRGKSKNRFLSEMMNQEMKNIESFKKILNTEDWGVSIIVFDLIDSVSHIAWDNKEICLEAYRFIDNQIGSLIEFLPNDCFIIIVSDHGMESSNKGFITNNWLYQNGFLNKKNSPSRSVLESIMENTFGKEKFIGVLQHTPIFNIIKKINSKVNIEGDYNIIDWDKTSAYGRGHLGQIYLTESSTIDIKEEIIGSLNKVKIVNEVYGKKDIYDGEYISRAPDIIFELKEGYTPLNTINHSSKILSELREIQKACHSQNGVFIYSGREIENKKIKLNITDIIPIILHISNIPIPFYMDGRVKKELFKKGSVYKEKSINKKEYNLGEIKRNKKYSDTNKEEVKERLKDLGYFS